MKKIILASSSPRRCALLNQMGISFDIIPSNINEDEFNHLTDKNLVNTLSQKKAFSVFTNIKSSLASADICVIGCDTIVSINNQPLGKPKDKIDALNMLIKLNNNIHTVFTGLTILGLQNGCYFEETICSSSDISFSNFSRKELMAYVDTLEPMDKAGSYAIQGKGRFLVSHINGDYYSIVGLPVNKLYNMLKKYNFL